MIEYRLKHTERGERVGAQACDLIIFPNGNTQSNWVWLGLYFFCVCVFELPFRVYFNTLQSTLVISNSKGLFEKIRVIQTLTYQIYRIVENK